MFISLNNSHNYWRTFNDETESQTYHLSNSRQPFGEVSCVNPLLVCKECSSRSRSTILLREEMIDDLVKWPWKENRKFVILRGFVTFVSTPHLFKINIPSIQIQGLSLHGHCNGKWCPKRFLMFLNEMKTQAPPCTFYHLYLRALSLNHTVLNLLN